MYAPTPISSNPATKKIDQSRDLTATAINSLKNSEPAPDPSLEQTASRKKVYEY
jgi:hypothetical protein